MLTSKEHIKLGYGRPDRTTIISADEILNLVIALNTAISFDDFLEMI